MLHIDNLKEKLEYEGLRTPVIHQVSNFIQLNYDAQIHHNKNSNNLENLTMYIVIKHTNSVRYFKTIKGYIVKERNDSSYVDSRELICLDEWNAKRIFRITIQPDKTGKEHELHIKRIDYDDLHKILFTLVEPTLVDYIISDDSTDILTKVKVEIDQIQGLTYKKLRSCILDPHLLNIKSKGVDLNEEEKDLILHSSICTLTDYSTN